MGSNYRDLRVWQKSIDFADELYAVTEGFPKNETFGLASQLRRAVVSAASNIAEGSARHSWRDFRRFLRQSRGSIAEIETQIIIAARRGYIPAQIEHKLLARSADIDRMLSGLITSLKKQYSADSPEQADDSED